LTVELAAMLPGMRDLNGVLVASLLAGSSRSAEALAAGDVIHSLNLKKVSTLEELRTALDGYSADTPVVLQVERAGRYRYVEFMIE
jgi:S1-C subfamily serine protease